MNQASADELARLPRVGPSLAGKIVAHREQNGPFKRAEDLMEVAGIGEKMFARPQAVRLRLRPDDADREGLLEGDRRQGRAEGEGEARRPATEKAGK